MLDYVNTFYTNNDSGISDLGTNPEEEGPVTNLSVTVMRVQDHDWLGKKTGC